MSKKFIAYWQSAGLYLWKDSHIIRADTEGIPQCCDPLLQVTDLIQHPLLALLQVAQCRPYSLDKVKRDEGGKKREEEKEGRIVTGNTHNTKPYIHVVYISLLKKQWAYVLFPSSLPHLIWACLHSSQFVEWFHVVHAVWKANLLDLKVRSHSVHGRWFQDCSSCHLVLFQVFDYPSKLQGLVPTTTRAMSSRSVFTQSGTAPISPKCKGRN